MSSSDIYILIFLIFLMLYILKKFNVFAILSYGGKIDSDFKECYIIKYPKKAELHNKGSIFEIDVDEFFRLNPKLKGKIPVEKREGLQSADEYEIRKEIKERKIIQEKYKKLSRQKPKKKRTNENA
ncbi:hypothetical protein AAX26_01298 [Aliarcobacter thereius]|uniref:Uncharacterized protein n=3 Tax=Aliarcobacter thereius TaxID=544718 RepID=A0A1C0B6S4_9BACT|nr:hypothetical protein [Aliarcobacter thereius]OCL86990.1 hypothetical protein AAX26_01298 [Aliarcobacter thereius]OCL91173.1 hypothetical protein AAX25_01343 [Aliarcobacter thereius]OCL95976.1 hypothetical protein AA347_01465 [Aliarcobacter thereius LMG 24486]OCL99305.1 hypothetical protein AAX29_01117 [Aliarcobacter thereius]QBF16052.1 hypothetical protein ATH_0985 [Aliarcobacter thereius LMG 24486]